MLIRKFFVTVLVGLGWLGSTGCDREIDRFRTNDLYGLVASRREAMDSAPALQDVNEVITELFGSPDRPRLPDSKELRYSLSEAKLMRAAGPFSSDQQGVHVGLYRKHCATCHGVEGGGAGPAAALLNPYPRDFRAGVFKFKSTGRADKPTHQDLILLLRRGIPGTAMPSFATEVDENLEALVDYVVYLSIRGETERRLIELVVRDELDPDTLREQATGIVQNVTASWTAADQRIVQVPPLASKVDHGSKDLRLVSKGRELFHGPLANCASCHGPSGNGTATTLDFDDWTKEYTTALGISPSDRDALKPMRLAGALKPRQIFPRKLQWRVFHGDDSDAALYRRLVTGIAGTPMPGLLVKDKPAGVGVEPNDVWAIIAYLRSLDADVPLATHP